LGTARRTVETKKSMVVNKLTARSYRTPDVIQYQEEVAVNDPYADYQGYAKKAGWGIAVNTARQFAGRALANPRARFGGEVN
jgi:hypothetical protein